MTNQVWWYLTRSTGIVAWALASASVIWGLLLSTRLVRRRGAPKWLLDLHRYLGGVTVAFVALHIGALVADSYVDFRSIDVLVPFASEWKPIPVALGVIATYALAAVEGSSLAMKHLPKRVWHRIHMAGFAVFVLATGHGLSAGTDTDNLAMFAAYSAVASAVVFLTIYRALTTRKSNATSRVPTRRPPASNTAGILTSDDPRPYTPGNGDAPDRERAQAVP